jgi:hypothetical protein
LYILFSYRSSKGPKKCSEEVILCNIGNLHPYHLLNLLAIRRFKGAKTPNIKWLKEMRRVRRHTKRNNPILLAVVLKIRGVVAFVAIKD